MGDESILPGGHSLAAAYPNPFNPTTTIGYTLLTTKRVSVKVRNSLGQLVAVLVDEIQTSGRHQVEWNAGRNVPSGTYFYTLETSEGAVTRSVTLVKESDCLGRRSAAQ